MSIIFFSFERA